MKTHINTFKRVALAAILLVSSLSFAQESRERFNKAVEAALQGKNSKAESELESILSSAKGDYRNEVLMALARTQFQAKKLDQAMKTLEKVERGSDRWFEAVEEKAWISLRQSNPDQALSFLETNLKELFLPIVGPESYFLAAYSHLRTCNYAEALKLQTLFKARFRPRVESLQRIVKSNGNDPIVDTTLNKFLDRGFTLKTAGKDAHFLPRLLVHDQKLTALFERLKATKGDVSTRSEYNQRVRELAKVDLEEMSRIINQFQVLEVEITQRVYSKQPLKTAMQGKNEDLKIDTHNRIRFPHDGEVWLDEVDKYRVQVKGCPGNAQGRAGKGKAI